MESIGARLGIARGAVFALAWLVVTFLVLPLFVVFPVAVTDTRYLAMPEKGISFQHFAKLVTSEDWLGSIWHSLTIAVVATVLCVVLGTLCAVGCWRFWVTRLSRGISAMAGYRKCDASATHRNEQ